jgi:TP901 family phage tail tape measure protein
MAEIIQKVGFDTAQAVTALNNLDAALKGVNRRLLAFNKRTAETASQKASASMDKLAASAKAAQGAVAGTGKALTRTGKEGAQAAQKITIGFQGLAKALVAREAVQALNALKTAILDSADAAAEFEESVARISNIAQGAGSTIPQLTESLSKLSIELGRPITEVAEAAFEALQNDLGTTRETMELLRTAAGDLALITGGTLTQSINAISSVLKSYDLDISRAAEVSDIFFAAIDKGRINLEELESSLGKITPLAARLDVDFQNVAAAMAAITQSGTSASVANTQLRSIFQKLIRPTEELDAAFQKLGVSTFNELIARSGNLQEALEQIAGALNNDDRAIAKAFGRLRGQLGVFNLLANEGKIFRDTLEAVTDSAGSAAAAAEVIRDTDAFRAREEGEQFAKTMREIGEAVLEAKIAFLAFANDVLPSGRAIADGLGFVLRAALALGGGAVVASLATFGTALTAALAPLLPFIGAAAVGFAAGEAIDAFFTSTAERLDEIADKLEETNERIAEQSEEALKQSNQEIDQLLRQRGEAVDDYVAGLAAAFEKETKILRDAAKRAEGLLKASIADFQSGMDGIFKSIKSQIKSVQNDLKSARGKATDAAQELADFRFDKDGRKLTETQNFNREMERAQKTGEELSKALKQAKTDPAAVQIRMRSDAAKASLGPTSWRSKPWKPRSNCPRAKWLAWRLRQKSLSPSSTRINSSMQNWTSRLRSWANNSASWINRARSRPRPNRPQIRKQPRRL